MDNYFLKYEINDINLAKLGKIIKFNAVFDKYYNFDEKESIKELSSLSIFGTFSLINHNRY